MDLLDQTTRRAALELAAKASDRGYEDLMKAVARRALVSRPQLKPAVRNRLNDRIRVRVRDKKVGDASRLPVDRLVPKLAAVSLRHPDLWDVLVEAWISSMFDEWHLVEQSCEGHALTVEGVRYSAEALRKTVPDLSLEDAVCFVAVALSRRPVAESPPKEDPDSVWLRIMQQVEAVPAEDLAWDSLEDFIDSLREMGTRKVAERSSARQVVEEALARLRTESGELLEYFELTGLEQWDPSVASRTGLTTSGVLLGNLETILREYARLLGEKPARIGDMVRWRERLTTLESEISQTWSRLDGLLRPGLGTEAIEAPSSVEGLAPETSARPLASATGSPEVAPELTEPTRDLPDQLEAAPQAPEAPPPAESEPAGRSTEAPGPEAPSQPSAPVPESLEPEPSGTGAAWSPSKPVPERPVPELSCDEGSSQPSLPVTEGPAPEPWAEIPSHPSCSASEEGQALGPLDEKTLVQQADLATKAPAPEPPAATPERPALPCDEGTEPLVLLAALLARDDIAGACWLARSHPSLPLPEWLLAAVLASRRLQDEASLLTADLLVLASEHQPAADGPQALLALAASLRTSILAPASGLVGWLRSPHDLPEVNGLVDVVAEFSSHQAAAGPEEFLGAAGREQSLNRLEQAAAEVRRWLDQAPLKTTRYQPASVGWHRLVSPQGELYETLIQAAEDRRGRSANVRTALQAWRHEEFLFGRVLANVKFAIYLDKKVKRELVRYADEGVLLGLQWCALVERERRMGQHGEFLRGQVARVRDGLLLVLPPVEARLAELSSGKDPLMAAAARCLSVSLEQLKDMIGGTAVQDGWMAGLEDLLQRRLLLLPELDLDELGRPRKDLRRALSRPRTLAEAYRAWLAREDYRFLDILEAELESEDMGVLIRERQEAERRSRAALLKEVGSATDSLEQAVLDGIVTDERSDLAAMIEAVRPDACLDFPAARRLLDEVRRKLADAREAMFNDLLARWHEKAQEVDAPAQELAAAAVARKDVRVLGEILTRLEEAPGRWPSLDPQTNFLDRFLKLAQPLERSLRQDPSLKGVQDALQQGTTWQNLDFGSLDPSSRTAAVESLEAWRRLKARKSVQPEHWARTLRFLGFSHPHLDRKHHSEDCIHFGAAMIPGDTRPIPDFGSLAHRNYDVVFLREGPATDMVASTLRGLKLGDRPILVLHLGPLTPGQRRNLSAVVRDRGAVVDEVLLVFLAADGGSRLQTMLHCTLPFGSVNPYTPFPRGNVPPEMFWGREEMLRELASPTGSCLVYGGRQLGKSALLQETERRFHQPDRDQYALIHDIRKWTDEPRKLWRVLFEELVHRKLLPRSTASRPELITQQIREMMASNPHRRLLVMLDEADDFLKEDGRTGFKVVTGLRDLMRSTENRFKIVFCGLHHVQRFQGLPNQPLAHLGQPILVGPLSPNSAEALVRNPFNAVGYRFDDPAAVLRILSYTNYHAGLLQIFCKELLRNLHQRGETGPPPRSITQEDVDAVYRSREVRDQIRLRFDLTLELDLRYQALAWSMIVDQMENPGSYAQAYAADELMRLAAGWWPQGFTGIDREGVRVYLNEMCGLGVLSRSGEGLYRLRSPNLVRLMGTENEVSNRLLDLATRSPVEEYEPDFHHSPLGHGRYSPLTGAQERELNHDSYGVGLVVGSRALGLDEVGDMSRRLLSEEQLESGLGIFAMAPPEEEFAAWLRTFIEKNEGFERAVVLADAAGDLAACVRTGLEFCRLRQTARKSVLRLLFRIGPEALWPWLEGPWQELEQQAVVVTARRWDEVAVARRLDELNLIHRDEVCRGLMEVTGGWPWLLDRVCRVCAHHGDARPHARELMGRLVEDADGLQGEFLEALGVRSGHPSHSLLITLAREPGSVPTEMIAPEIFETLGRLDHSTCARATTYLVRLGCLVGTLEEVEVEPTLRTILRGQ